MIKLSKLVLDFAAFGLPGVLLLGLDGYLYLATNTGVEGLMGTLVCALAFLGIYGIVLRYRLR